uniref:ABC transporter ATP-binding protein/permease n=1 Tax=uncultured Caulobacter sp. TaxID=158749 RepID=UPI0025CC26D3|nr:ATP-binding cassette domain-containing protein [uncultured Caulobacter sp.]
MSDPTLLIDPAAADAVKHERPPESSAKALWPDIKHGGALLKRYVKADPIVGPLLFAAELCSGAVTSVLFMQMQVNLAAVTNALAAKDGSVIGGLLGKVVLAGAIMAVVGMIVAWTRYTLRIRFRRVLTENLLERWIRNNRFYHMERRAQLDYPEQRIQEDIFQFIERLTTIAPLILFAFFSIFLYTSQLWRLSPPIVIDSIGLTHPVSGFLVYIAFGFAILWTVVTHLVGQSLTRAEVVRQRLEAQFRQEMAAVRENGESIAFARGAPIEAGRLANTFYLIRSNWRFYTLANLKITFIRGLPETFMLIGPTLLCAPFVISGKMQIGDIALVGASFGQVYGGVGVLIAQYADLAILRSSVARLRLLDELLAMEIKSDIIVQESAEPQISVRNLSIAYPDGHIMNAIGDLTIAPGARLLVKGPSGAGKSTLLRSIAGLWPFGAGSVALPKDAAIAFLPQRGYMPNGTLAGLMSYPRTSDAHDDETYAALLKQLGLGKFVSRLHDFQPWSRILSPGEQQRIAAARAILAKPDYLFADEATSALDPQSEARLYDLLAERLPHAALVSVAHRPAVERFHDTVLTLEDGKALTTRAASPTGA